MPSDLRLEQGWERLDLGLTFVVGVLRADHGGFGQAEPPVNPVFQGFVDGDVALMGGTLAKDCLGGRRHESGSGSGQNHQVRTTGSPLVVLLTQQPPTHAPLLLGH